MRIIYLGTPDFAVPSLETLVQNGYKVVGVVTAPDKPAGRGLKVQESEVKQAARKLNLPIFQPTNLKDPDFQAELKALNAHLQIVVAFRMLPEAIWNMPPLGTFNLHASLLPQYRGAAPINWAIINGEKETGLTTFFLQHQIDTGDIILQEKETIRDDDTAGTLHDRLKIKGADLVLKTVRLIEKGDYVLQKQLIKDPDSLKTAPKIFTEHTFINFRRKGAEILNFIRGLTPYPMARMRLNDKIYKLFEADFIKDDAASELMMGEFRTDGKTFLHIRIPDGYLAVQCLQAEGRKKMSIGEFLRGNKL
jgi:methionyl-tRNA formyltransferase